jgi:hypothetical protein
MKMENGEINQCSLLPWCSMYIEFVFLIIEIDEETAKLLVVVPRMMGGRRM